MAGIRTVNLLWERRIRGVYPVAPYALRNDGALSVAIPRPLEPRAYDLTRLALDGGAEVLAGFAVETLLKLEVTTSGENCVGMTADDLYLFHAGDKQRFLGERQLLYIDCALSAEGSHLATAFSDRAGASYVLAYGGIDGRVAWMRDMDMPLTSVAMSRAGNRILAGMETGIIQLFDASRRDVWEFGQGEPVRALACSEDGIYVAYGTALGGVGVVDGQGTRIWEARLPGGVRAIAVSGDGRLCAALCSPEKDPGVTRLFCLEETGRIGWEYDAEQLLQGLSLTANGRYLATSARNGTITVYEVVPGEHATAAVENGLAGALSLAEALTGTGDWQGACEALEAALQTDPGAVAAYEQLVSYREQVKRIALQQAHGQSAAGEFAAAIKVLEAAWRRHPYDHDLISALLSARRQCGEQLLAEAQASPPDSMAAEMALLAAVVVDPTLVEARRELGVLRAQRVKQADEEAERLLAASELEAGVAALERAQALAPTPERIAKLERAYTAMEFAAGMAAYNEKRYQEAVFQFKKALHRDPSHAEAKRYLGFAQKFAQDTANDSLNDRFSRLE